MAYCGPRGIPLSAFLDWSPHDQAAALAWTAHEASRCPGCGTHRADWDEAQGGDRHAYAATVRECQGCVQVEMVRDTPEARRRGARIHMIRK